MLERRVEGFAHLQVTNKAGQVGWRLHARVMPGAAVKSRSLEFGFRVGLSPKASSPQPLDLIGALKKIFRFGQNTQVPLDMFSDEADDLRR
jgi:hypothetical protein